MEPKPFDQFITDFLASLLKDMNLGPMTEDEQKRMRSALEEHVEKRILSTIVDNLSDELFKELVTKLGEREYSEEEEVAIFAEMSRRIPNFADLVAKNLRELYLELTRNAAEIEALTSEYKGK